jgi:hypothetical protein
MRIRQIAISAAFAAGAAALLPATAAAQYQYNPLCSWFPLTWPFCVAGAVLGTAARIVTAVSAGRAAAVLLRPVLRAAAALLRPAAIRRAAARRRAWLRRARAGRAAADAIAAGARSLNTARCRGCAGTGSRRGCSRGR